MANDIFDGEIFETDANLPERKSERQKSAPDRPIKVMDKSITALQAAAPGPERLVAYFSPEGKLLVAIFVDGNPTEKWRAPTPEEVQALKERGQVQPLTRGAFPLENRGSKGLAGWMPESTVGQVAVVGGLVAVGAAAFWGYQKWKEQKAAKEEEDLELDED